MTRLRFRAVRHLLLLLVALLATTAGLPAQKQFYLHDNDTVVFYGDSITDQRLYTTFIEAFVVTRYPSLQVRFVHSGWGGDRVTGGGGGGIDERLQRDVIAYKPTVMTIMLGMNDASYRAFDEEIFHTYTSGYEHILAVMKEAILNLRLTLIQPSPFDDVTQPPQFPGGYNGVLLRYADFVKALAERNHTATADLNRPVVEALQKANSLDPEGAKQIIRDRVHPGAGGHLLMAEALLKAWGATPLVSAVEIDAAAKKVARADNTAVTNLAVDKSVSWTQKDEALPMPVDLSDPALPGQVSRAAATVELAVKASDFIEALDQQTLRVRGLGAAQYTLKINGKTVGSFSRAQLEEGLNLATLPTPMAQQATAVLGLTFERVSLHQTRWREIQMPFKDDNLARLPAILDNLDALGDDVRARQRAAAQPATCFYELIPQ